jgi:rhamnosyltransferase
MIISIIIITKDQYSTIRQTLKILRNQMTSHLLEIIVIDSGQDTNIKELSNKYKCKYVAIDSKKFHYAKVFNNALQMSSGEIVIRLSGDVIPIGTNYIEQLLWGIDDSNVAATFGRYICIDPNKRLPFAWPKARFLKQKHIYDEKLNSLSDILLNLAKFERMRNLTGGACAIKRKYLIKRNFNENIFEGEDSEYAIYLHTINKSIAYNPDATSLHEHNYRKINFRLIFKFIKIWTILIIEIIKTYYKYRK